MTGHVGIRYREVVAVLARHPEGLRSDQLRAKLGYRVSEENLRWAISWLRRHGLPIRSTPAGSYRVNYRLEQEAA